MKPRNLVPLLTLLLAGVSSSPGAAQLTPPSTGGIVELDRLLQRVAEPLRVLMVAAHPDDEDTGLLARLALGDGAEAAYLALSRGEGGQNLIGSELGADLGLLRSRELEAARRVDGARQFFTRAFDFGFTRSLDETATKWPLDSLLKDAVRIVRRFRPHIMISVFTGTPRDGHGQHQAAGVTARRAFEVAGDPSVFPELATEEGLEPWTPLKLYRSTRFDASATTASLSTGDIDPRTGLSYYQVAMASRSQHRSQDMGMLQPIGPRQSTVQLLEDRTAGDDGTDPFAGIAINRGRIGDFADSLRAHVTAATLPEVARALAAEMPRDADDPRYPLLEQALAVASGLVIDGVASRAEVVPGDTFTVTVSVFNGGPEAVRLDGMAPTVPDGWTVESAGDGPSDGDALAPEGIASASFVVRVPPDAPLTTPYFLVGRLWKSMYDWSKAPPAVRGLPFQPPLVNAESYVRVGNALIRLHREVAYRFRDQAYGEIRRAVRVVPGVDVKLAPARLVWPVDRFPTRDFAVTLTSNRTGAVAGEVTIQVDGWTSGASPARQRFRFDRPGESRSFTFTLSPPPGVQDTALAVRAVAVDDDGRRYSEGVDVISYPHIRPVARARPAVSRIVLSSIALPLVSRVGYIRGAADRVPEALMQLGLNLDLLTEDQLAGGDLSAYDVIIVGSRAYETDEALQRHNDRLLDYARAGGHLVVQYQQYAFVNGNYAPYPLEIARPHDRVTDETAPVTVLDPASPLFHSPNRIGPDDWDGWPQERGLYFAHRWDDAYRPLLEMNDPGSPPLRGGLLVADYGAGTYVYTGLSFFRSLPAGNPGAFKLFLNLVGWKGSEVP